MKKISSHQHLSATLTAFYKVIGYILKNNNQAHLLIQSDKPANSLIIAWVLLSDEGVIIDTNGTNTVFLGRHPLDTITENRREVSRKALERLKETCMNAISEEKTFHYEVGGLRPQSQNIVKLIFDWCSGQIRTIPREDVARFSEGEKRFLSAFKQYVEEENLKGPTTAETIFENELAEIRKSGMTQQRSLWDLD